MCDRARRAREHRCRATGGATRVRAVQRSPVGENAALHFEVDPALRLHQELAEQPDLQADQAVVRLQRHLVGGGARPGVLDCVRYSNSSPMSRYRPPTRNEAS